MYPGHLNVIIEPIAGFLKSYMATWPHHAKTCLCAYADSEVPDQPAHLEIKINNH